MSKWEAAKARYTEALMVWTSRQGDLADLRMRAAEAERHYNAAGDALALAQRDLFEAAKQEAYTLGD